MENMLNAQNVWFRYSQESDWALKGIDLQVKKGEFVAVLGSNGCGKSTLAKLFNAIIVPEKGDVIVEGINTKDEEKLLDIRQRVGMVFQNPDNQIVATVVEEDVAFALENMGVEPAEIRRRIDDAMQNIGIYQHREKGPHQLSGGQKQRVAIARAILRQSPIIVLDEATASVDVQTEKQIQKAIKNLAGKQTIIAIAHRLSTIRDADIILVFHEGRITERGTHEELLAMKGLYYKMHEAQSFATS